jgi:uncharacterized protein YdhG (YjbR/CyaY superfamily)
MKAATAKDIDDYIFRFPAEVQAVMQELRSTIRKAAPEAQETINYQMPTFVLEGNLVHFAGYKNHIGFYPAPSGIERFSKELSAFELSKGTVRFPLDRPIPFDLIIRIVQFRVNENLEKATSRKALKQDRKV